MVDAYTHRKYHGNSVAAVYDADVQDSWVPDWVDNFRMRIGRYDPYSICASTVLGICSLTPTRYYYTDTLLEGSKHSCS